MLNALLKFTCFTLKLLPLEELESNGQSIHSIGSCVFDAIVDNLSVKHLNCSNAFSINNCNLKKNNIIRFVKITFP